MRVIAITCFLWRFHAKGKNNKQTKQKQTKKKNLGGHMEVPSWRNGVNFRKIGKVPNENPSHLMCMVNQKEKEKIHGNQIFTLAKDENSPWKS